MKLLYKISIICLLFPLVVFATNDKCKGKFTKEKKISKEFTVANDANLDIDNKYGNVTIATWDENRIVIDITIKTNGDNEDKVKERLNDISINLVGKDRFVKAKTIIGNEDSSWGWKNKKNVSMEINYVVKMPKSNSLDLTNIYGAITLGDLNGNAKIKAKYGQVAIGNLNAIYNDITLKYVKGASIEFLKYGTLTTAYSTVNVAKAGDVKLFADYTKMNLGTLGSLKYTNRYGKLEINTVKDIIGKGSYNGVIIGSITGKANFDLKYSGLTVSQLTASVKSVNVDGKYSRISLGVDIDYYFNFNADISYGGLKGVSLLTLEPLDENHSQNKHFQGYHGSKNTSNTMQIDSSYGSVTFKRN